MNIKYLLLFILGLIIAYAVFFSEQFLWGNDRSFLDPTINKERVKEEIKNFIIDSDDPKILLDNLDVPNLILDQITLLNVEYLGFDSLIHRGQIIVNKSVEKEVVEIFKELLIEKFPIQKVIPINHYNWDDDLSMQDNNTSSFNYRTISNSNRLSTHALGLAIDINPKINPYFSKSGVKSPSNGSYNKDQLGTITDTTKCFQIFKKYGWKWGGKWSHTKDFQHFSKNGR